jgi:hypothetical protein
MDSLIDLLSDAYIYAAATSIKNIGMAIHKYNNFLPASILYQK